MLPAEAAWVSEPREQKAVQSSEGKGDGADGGYGEGRGEGGGSMWRVSPHCETVASEGRLFHALACARGASFYDGRRRKTLPVSEWCCTCMHTFTHFMLTRVRRAHLSAPRAHVHVQVLRGDADIDAVLMEQN